MRPQGVHETCRIPTGQYNFNPPGYEVPDRPDSTSVEKTVRVRYCSVNIRQQGLQHGLRPASSTMNGASPSGRFGAVHQAGYSFPALALSEVQPEGGRMPDNITADGFCGVTKEYCRVGHDLVCHERYGIVLIDKLEQLMHVPVQFLLPCRKRASSRIFGPGSGR